jgi:SagB-type dehydrogenase family enzyme
VSGIGPRTRFRRSPHLVVYWQQRTLVVHNYATGARVAADPLVCEILDRCGDWRTLARLTAASSRAEIDALRAIVSELTRRSVLDRSDGRVPSSRAAMSGWNDWAPIAPLFHFATKNTSYHTDIAQAERKLRRQAASRPMPPPVKTYPRAARVALPEARVDGELPRALRERRTWRHFSSAPLRLGNLATLLHLTWGVQRWGNVFGQGDVPLKTSPSGGARHPIEAYVVARRVQGLAPGIYHYAADRHALERLRRGATGRDIVRYVAGQRWYAAASAIVIMTAVFPREQWRYKSPRAYRTVLIDAGHLCQTFCLVATWLGLAPFCTMALSESRIERDLGLDGVAEAPMYVAGVGTRPAGGWNARLQRAALRR